MGDLKNIKSNVAIMVLMAVIFGIFHLDRWLIIIQATMSEPDHKEIRDILANSLDVFNDVKELIEQGQQIGEIISGDSSHLATAFLSLLQGLE